MTGLEAIGAIAPSAGQPVIDRIGLAAATPGGPAGQAGFGTILAEGMRNVDARVASANELVRRFAVDDSVPLHQVTYALEEARLAVELAMQVRGRLVEGYREIMNMQL